MSRPLKTKLSHSQRNKKIHFCDKFGIKVPNITREALMMDMMNNNTLWLDDITKDMYTLE